MGCEWEGWVPQPAVPILLHLFPWWDAGVRQGPLWAMRTGASLQKCRETRQRGLSNMPAGTLTRENVMVRVLHRNRANGIYSDIPKGTLIIGIGACDYGEREVPPSATCKPSPRDAGGVAAAQAQGGGNQGANGVSPGLSLKSREPVTGRASCNHAQ